MDRPGAILQIVPRAPGGQDGVGDYAFTLARHLLGDYKRQTVFAAAVGSAIAEVGDFRIMSPLDTISEDKFCDGGCDHIVLHYVNYGYQRRGVPISLVSMLRRLRRLCGGRLVTVFHELYASGRPWKSAFWLRPVQRRIAREISRISDASVVSSEPSREQLRRLAPRACIAVYPVFSNFGEPELSPQQIAGRDLHRWAICGGTHLIERSLLFFLRQAPSIPARFLPNELFIIGGADNSAIRKTLQKLTKIKCHYFPRIDVSVASHILSSCAFGWIDYFDRPGVPTAAILKSTTFAAYCAHGVIPVFPHSGSEIAINGDRLCGPYFVAKDRNDLPEEPRKIGAEIYAWYQRRACSKSLAAGIAAALCLTECSRQTAMKSA